MSVERHTHKDTAVATVVNARMARIKGKAADVNADTPKAIKGLSLTTTSQCINALPGDG